MVRTLRAELGTEHGTVQRVADQLGYGVESVRKWVRQADIDDGARARGDHGARRARIAELEQENRELRRANEILKRAAAFFAAELDRRTRGSRVHRRQPRRRRRGRARGRAHLHACCRWPRAPTTPPRPGRRRRGRMRDAVLIPQLVGAVGGQLPGLRGPQAVEGRPPGRPRRRPGPGRPADARRWASKASGAPSGSAPPRPDPVAARHPDLVQAATSPPTRRTSCGSPT